MNAILKTVELPQALIIKEESVRTLIVFLFLCFGFIALPYAVGLLSLGHDATFIEAFSFGLMLVSGFSLLITLALKTASAYNSTT